MGKKHSRIGIASFIIAVISIAGIIITSFVMVGLAESLFENATSVRAGEIAVPENAGSLLAVSGLMFLFVILSLIGAVLGVIGLFQKDRLKLFSVLGLTFNGLLAFVIVAVVFVSALAGPPLPGTF